MNVHVIIGEDDYLVSEAAKKIVASSAELELVDSALSSNEESQMKDIRAADASFSTPPFLEPSKATWWKNVGFLPQAGGKKGPSEAVKDALVAFAEKIAANPPPDNQVFVLTGPRLLMTSVFAKTLKKGADIQSFAALKPWERERAAVVAAIDGAKERGLVFELGAAEEFIAVVGDDTRSIMSELDKMRDFLGGKKKKISLSDIGEITSPGAGVETPLWSLTDAIGARDAAKSLDVVARFEGDAGFPVMATTVLERFFRNLAELKDAAMRGKADDTASELFGSPWAAKKNIALLSKWSLQELRLASARFLQLRERAVSGASDAGELVAVEILRSIRSKAKK